MQRAEAPIRPNQRRDLSPEDLGPDSAAASDGRDGGDRLGTGEIAHAAARGAIAAMAMTGMRAFTVSVGLVEEPPPQAIFRQRAPRLLRSIPRRYRRAAVELAHWGYGAAGGAVFGALPEGIRRRGRWTGPLYGLGVWAGFEAGIAPALGLRQAHEKRPVERLALAGDHLLYGLVLSEIRARPRR